MGPWPTECNDSIFGRSWNWRGSLGYVLQVLNNVLPYRSGAAARADLFLGSSWCPKVAKRFGNHQFRQYWSSWVNGVTQHKATFYVSCPFSTGTSSILCYIIICFHVSMMLYAHMKYRQIGNGKGGIIPIWEGCSLKCIMFSNFDSESMPVPSIHAPTKAPRHRESWAKLNSDLSIRSPMSHRIRCLTGSWGPVFQLLAFCKWTNIRGKKVR